MAKKKAAATAKNPAVKRVTLRMTVEAGDDHAQADLRLASDGRVICDLEIHRKDDLSFAFRHKHLALEKQIPEDFKHLYSAMESVESALIDLMQASEEGEPEELP